MMAEFRSAIGICLLQQGDPVHRRTTLIRRSSTSNKPSDGENQLFTKLASSRSVVEMHAVQGPCEHECIRLQVDDDEMDADMQATSEEQARKEASAQAEDRSDGEDSMDEDDDVRGR